MMREENIIFEDKDVKITQQSVTIKCYYFPIGTSKVIPFKDIQKVEVRQLGMARMRIWGMDLMAWGYWFPGDCQRCSRDQYIAVYIGKCIIPSFTTEHTAIVYNILMQELRKIKRFETQNPLNKDSQVSPKQNQNSMHRPIMHS